MKCKEFFIKILIDNGVTDVFGIPGGVVLDFMESADKHINARLSFHEQSAVFSAMGSARGKGGLGVAYATRGPGITNTLTSVSDAFFDSVPIVVVTGHSGELPRAGMRTLSDQENDVVSIFRSVTKSAIRVETPEEFVLEAPRLVELAKSGRQGPVLIDVKSSIWNQDAPISTYHKSSFPLLEDESAKGYQFLSKELSVCRRPLLLLGDGFRGNRESIKDIVLFARKFKIPILSGRFSQDLFKPSSEYFGYFGSHGLRSGNFLLSKADLIISIGNRMHYPTGSKSWGPLMSDARVLWFDVDPSEFSRNVPNSVCFNSDLVLLSKMLLDFEDGDDYSDWKAVCEEITNKLKCFDVSQPISFISDILNKEFQLGAIVSDVGNHEFWVARGYFESESDVPLIFSKSFGAMGSALGKAIGLAHSLGNTILCFVGDQGLMMNIQDLHYIVQNKLPIKIILLNNNSSGMIRSRQLDSGREVLQTTVDTGYSTPEFLKIGAAFGIHSISVDGHDATYSEIEDILKMPRGALIEVLVNPEFVGRPHLPAGECPTRLEPKIPDSLHLYLESL